MRHHRTAPHDQDQHFRPVPSGTFFEPRRERRHKTTEWWVHLTLAVLSVPTAIAACSAALGADTGTWWMKGGLYLGSLVLVLIGAGSLVTALEKRGKR